jgi:hypothetical protein
MHHKLAAHNAGGHAELEQKRHGGHHRDGHQEEPPARNQRSHSSGRREQQDKYHASHHPVQLGYTAIRTAKLADSRQSRPVPTDKSCRSAA